MPRQRRIPQASTQASGGRAQKPSLIALRHLRLRVKDIAMTDALEDQRGTPWPDLSRRIYERGCRVEASCGPPNEHGIFGTESGLRLAQLQAGDVDALIAFQMRFGQTPTIIQVLLDLVQKQEQGHQTLSASAIAALLPQGNPGSGDTGRSALTEVVEGADRALDIFFSN